MFLSNHTISVTSVLGKKQETASFSQIHYYMAVPLTHKQIFVLILLREMFVPDFDFMTVVESANRPTQTSGDILFFRLQI